MIPHGSVAQRAVASGVWATVLNGSDRLLHLGKLVIVARVLPPADFGLFGIALLTLATLRRFSDLGLSSALVQREQDDLEDYLDTVLTLRLVRGIGLAGIAFLAAPYVAVFFAEPRAESLIRVLALSPILLALQNPGVVYLERNLEFHKRTIHTLSDTVVNVTIAIAVAVTVGTVWALVAGLLAGHLSGLAATYAIHPYRPRPRFDAERARELLGYGKWLTGSGIVTFLVGEGDDAFVGWFLGAGALGLYQVAYRISNAPASEFTQIISGVLFPTYAQLQDDMSRLRETFVGTLQVTTLVTVPTAVGIAFVAPIFVQLIFDPAWLPMVGAIQVLAAYGLAQAVAGVGRPLLLAIGRPDYATKLSLLRLVIVVLIIYPLTAAYGIVGAGAAIVIGRFATMVVGLAVTLGVLELHPRLIAGPIFVPVTASGAMVVGLLGLRELGISFRLALELPFVIGTGIALYAAVILLFQGVGLYDLRWLGRRLTLAGGQSK